ncbi:MAG: hypothetical protein EZS28_033505 [Streblomastix strix]|uniref:Uncharacterized protein n=1 Tax=Streblomastix strix TaxID=222440 RepID=A0A5J4UKE4_9EUKA|nr:MAG: hypothetical protein EZS28_033505 [Streblomastix strix]
MKSIKNKGEEKSSEERMNIIEQGGLKEICKVIHSSLEGEMDWNKQYLIELGCEAASNLLEDNKESIPFAIEIGGIIDQIISLLNKLPIENINEFHLLPLFNIICLSNFEQRKILAEKGILKEMNKILNSKNEQVLDYSTYILMKIIYSIGQLEGEGKPNPVREEMKKDGTLTKLIEIFQNDQYINKDINSRAACSIGRLYKASPLPSEIEYAIINCLKELAICSNYVITSESFSTLSLLAECQIGYLEEEGKPNPLLKEMEKDGTLNKLIQIHQNKTIQDKRIFNYSTLAIGYLFKASPLPSEFGQSIISNLQDLTQSDNIILQSDSLLALSLLAQCEQSCTNTYIRIPSILKFKIKQQ